jgi:hypothetical protein
MSRRAAATPRQRQFAASQVNPLDLEALVARASRMAAAEAARDVGHAAVVRVGNDQAIRKLDLACAPVKHAPARARKTIIRWVRVAVPYEFVSSEGARSHSGTGCPNTRRQGAG